MKGEHQVMGCVAAVVHLSSAKTHLEVGILHVLKDKAGRARIRVLYHIHQVYDVGASADTLQ
jgi:hypothetical protein